MNIYPHRTISIPWQMFSALPEHFNRAPGCPKKKGLARAKEIAFVWFSRRAHEIVVIGLEVPFALVCDDVRREDNGKEILIGVYSSDIRVNRFPANLRIVCWMQTIIKVPNVEFRLRIIGPNGAQLANADVVVQKPRDAYPIGPVALGPLAFQVQSAGDLVFEIADKSSENWQEVKRIPVAQADLARGSA